MRSISWFQGKGVGGKIEKRFRVKTKWEKDQVWKERINQRLQLFSKRCTNKQKVETYLGEWVGGGTQHVWTGVWREKQSCKEKHVSEHTNSLSLTHIRYFLPLAALALPSDSTTKEAKSAKTWLNQEVKFPNSNANKAYVTKFWNSSLFHSNFIRLYFFKKGDTKHTQKDTSWSPFLSFLQFWRVSTFTQVL